MNKRFYFGGLAASPHTTFSRKVRHQRAQKRPRHRFAQTGDFTMGRTDRDVKETRYRGPEEGCFNFGWKAMMVIVANKYQREIASQRCCVVSREHNLL